MSTDVQEFAGLDEFSAEDNAEFGIGTNDLYVNWASKQNLDDGSVISGWYTKIGRKDFDDACESYNAANPKNPIKRVTAAYVKEQEEIWVFPSGFSFFVICKGLGEAYKPELRSSAPDLGMMYVWAEEVEETVKNGTKERRVSRKSFLQFRAIISELVEYGWGEPVQVRTKGQGKGSYTFKALQAHQKTLTAFKTFMGKKDMPLPFYSFSIPFGCSKLTEIGTKPNSTMMIVPMSLAPESPDKAYFASHYIGNHPIADIVKSMIKDAMDDTVQWAQSTAKKLYSSGSGESDNESNGHSSTTGHDSGDPFMPEFNENAPDFEEEAPTTRKPMADDKEPATDQMRDMLKKFATRKGQTGWTFAAKNPKLTKGEARQIFFEANTMPDVRQN